MAGDPTVRNGEGWRVYDEYHLHASRRFTDAVMLKLTESVVLGKHAHEVDNHMPTESGWGCLSDEHLPAHCRDNKEDQPEHQRPPEIPGDYRSFATFALSSRQRNQPSDVALQNVSSAVIVAKPAGGVVRDQEVFAVFFGLTSDDDCFAHHQRNKAQLPW
jgi:hypothetical protein